jgi:hypothetical protein
MQIVFYYLIIFRLYQIYKERIEQDVWSASGTYEDRTNTLKHYITDFKKKLENTEPEMPTESKQQGMAEGWTKLPSGDYQNSHTGVRTSKPPAKKKRGEKTGAEWDAIEKAKKEQGVAEGMSDDMAAMAQKKFPNAYISKDGEEVQKPKNWGKRYTPPAAAPVDLEKQQRDLTARYPNIDELVRRAELNRDPNYERADGQAYYAARDAEQNYLKLKQIQRVIQGLNESLDRSHLP